MKSVKTHLRVVSTAVCLTMVSGAPLLDAAERPDFSGTWRLNEDLSENPREKMREAMESRRRASGIFDSGRGGRRGGRGDGGRGGAMGEGRQGRRAGLLFGEGADELTIRHDDPMLSITDASGRKRDFKTDGRTIEIEGERGNVEIRATWKKGERVEITTERERVSKVKETYELAPEGRQLIVTLRMEGGRMPTFSCRRVYDAAKAEVEAEPSPKSREP